MQDKNTMEEEQLPQINKENKMGVLPVGKLLMSMAVPMMISMLVMALYNIVDSIFVAKLGEDALAAVSLAFPIQNLIIAVAVGIGVGANTCISKNLGRKDYEMANKSAGNSFVLGMILMVAFLLFGIFGVRWFFNTQTDEQVIINYGVDYLSIICMCSFALFGQIIFEKILVSTGKTMLTMLMQLFGAVVNIILDPILIFGYLGAPKMGVKGAALATVIGQICALILAAVLNFVYNKEVKIRLKDFILSKKVVLPMLAVGIPSMVMSAIGSVMNLGLNAIVGAFSMTAVAFLGIVIKINSFVLMPIFGVCNSLVPIASYNLGAQKYERINKSLIISLIVSGIIALIGMILMMSIPQYLLKMFDASENMLEIGVVGFRIFAVGMLFSCFSLVASSYFQALGKSFSSLAISVCRQLVIILPVAYLLSLTKQLKYVWWAFPIAEVICLFASIAIVFVCQKMLKRLKNEKDMNMLSGVALEVNNLASVSNVQELENINSEVTDIDNTQDITTNEDIVVDSDKISVESNDPLNVDRDNC